MRPRRAGRSDDRFAKFRKTGKLKKNKLGGGPSGANKKSRALSPEQQELAKKRKTLLQFLGNKSRELGLRTDIAVK